MSNSKFPFADAPNTACFTWSKVTEFSVGGLMWVGFSKRQPHRLLCISSQYSSLVDCNTGDIAECDAEYDEECYAARTSCLPDEVVDIYGIYGGSPLLHTNAGDEISITKQKERFGNKTVIRTKGIFNTHDGEMEFYNDYGFYTCSFSVDGNYFVLAEDAGITVLKRNSP